MDKSEKTGAELFEFYTSMNNSYSQTLYTAFLSIGFDLYPMLEEAEIGGKQIALEDIKEFSDSNDQPFRVVLKSLRKKRALKILSYYAPCLLCKNLENGGKCKAFPNGIPNKILEGNHNHQIPLKTQKNSIVFDPIY